MWWVCQTSSIGAAWPPQQARQAVTPWGQHRYLSGSLCQSNIWSRGLIRSHWEEKCLDFQGWSASSVRTVHSERVGTYRIFWLTEALGAALFSVLFSAWQGVSTWAPLGCAQAVPETMACNVLGTSLGRHLCCLITGKLFNITGNTQIGP